MSELQLVAGPAAGLAKTAGSVLCSSRCPMSVALFILAGFGIASGCLTLVNASTVFQQTVGMLGLVIGSILLGSGAIVRALNQLAGPHHDTKGEGCK